MLSILKAFGLSQEKQDHPYMPRQINLAGNIVNFSMPENFSLDFPADDLVEVLNINNEKSFKEKKPITLLRRWWDFKDDSFFSKNVGSMMMTIHIYQVLDKSKNISHPIDFIQALLLEMNNRDQEVNKGLTAENKMFFADSYQFFVERQYNNQKWLRSGSGTMDEDQIIYHYWIPLTEQNYLQVEFHFAPDNNIPMRRFIDTHCRDILEKIMSTFEIIYSNENPIKLKLEKNSQLVLDKLIKELD